MVQDILTNIPTRWQGAIIGATVGVVISIVLLVVVEAAWGALVGLAAGAVLAIVGFVLGTSFEWREEMQDHADK